MRTTYRLILVAALRLSAIASEAPRAESPSIGVAVLHSVPWSPNAPAREGAGEFEVLLHVAQLQHDHAIAGLLSVGDHNGTRQCGGENALRHAALSGLPVVKLAPHGAVASSPDALFVDGGTLNEDHARQLLEKCLARFGAPPAAVDPDRPTARELAAIRTHLRPFQEAFASAAQTFVALQ